MADGWCWFLLIFVLVEITTCSPKAHDRVHRQPHGSKKLGKTLLDAKLNQQHGSWSGAYQATRDNRASVDGSEEGDGPLHSGKYLDLFNDESVHEPRFSAQQRSASTSRRARSQAQRRDKLNSQSLRNHQIHTRRAAGRRREWIMIH